jgi:hypothetical protein
VAAIAWSRLSPSTRARVSGLLRLNPQYRSWIAGAAPEKQDQIAFLRAATWADAIKKMPQTYISDGPEGGNRPPNAPEAAQNVGYSDHFMHRYWHYIDHAFSSDGTPLSGPDVPNARTQIAAFRAALASDAPDDIKSYDLVWLLHLVGDVHQPLHAMSRFTRTQPNGDRGGNDVRILCGGACSATLLHSFWDGVVGGRLVLDAQEVIDAAAAIAEPDPALSGIADEEVWIGESFALARTIAYADPIGAGEGPFALSDDYKSRALGVARQRIALAGIRLANLLNAALR